MELDSLLGDFAKLGVDVAAVSANSREVAERTVEEWGLSKLTVGYGLKTDEAARWGLFVSRATKETEPDLFVEPGIFVIRGDRTLYSSIVQTMPFSRPRGSELLKTLEFVIDKGFPARGEVVPTSG